MNTEIISQVLATILPAIVIGGLAYYFFKMYFDNEADRRKFSLQKESQKDTLPLKLSAYERFALYLERVAPKNLLIRVAPSTENKTDYVNLLAAHIDQEFEHNIAQQIYISQECWDVIKSSKNSIIQLMRTISEKEEITNSAMLREEILKSLLNKQSPADVALSFIKNEVGELM